jgi:small subunit ribosomal protein S21
VTALATTKNLEISIHADDNIERCLKKFKRLCEGYGIVREYRKRKEHRKPSVRNKEKRESAEKRRFKTDTKFNRFKSKI